MNKDDACSFCGRKQEEVRKLIAGPLVFICDECVNLCNDIVAEEESNDERTAKRFRGYRQLVDEIVALGRSDRLEWLRSAMDRIETTDRERCERFMSG